MKYELYGEADNFKHMMSHCLWPGDYKEWCSLQECYREAIWAYPKRVKDPKDQTTWFDPGT